MIQCGDQMESKNVPAEGHIRGQAGEILYRHEVVEKIHLSGTVRGFSYYCLRKSIESD